jgi:hypothetical protein
MVTDERETKMNVAILTTLIESEEKFFIVLIIG